LYDRYSRFYGKDDPDTLVVMGTSLEFNPTLDESIIDREIERDPERAQAEYLCKWRDDLSQFIDREMVEAAIERGIRVRPRDERTSYVGFTDASSGRGDSFALGIAHKEPGSEFYVLDHLWERQSPFNVEAAVDEAAKILRSYGLAQVTGDKYSVGFVEDAFRRQRIRYVESEQNKSEIYLAALPLFTTGRVRLLDNPRLVHQLTSLERRTSPVGKDMISHPDHRNARDDLANAACGALSLAATRTPWVITPELVAEVAAGLIRRPGWSGINFSWGGRPRSKVGVFI
jgi:hypothetical protein